MFQFRVLLTKKLHGTRWHDDGTRLSNRRWQSPPVGLCAFFGQRRCKGQLEASSVAGVEPSCKFSAVLAPLQCSRGEPHGRASVAGTAHQRVVLQRQGAARRQHVLWSHHSCCERDSREHGGGIWAKSAIISWPAVVGSQVLSGDRASRPCPKSFLAGGDSNIFLLSSRTLGKMNPIWRAYFSKGLVQPPTSFVAGLDTLSNFYSLCVGLIDVPLNKKQLGRISLWRHKWIR